MINVEEVSKAICKLVYGASDVYIQTVAEEDFSVSKYVWFSVNGATKKALIKSINDEEVEDMCSYPVHLIGEEGGVFLFGNNNLKIFPIRKFYEFVNPDYVKELRGDIAYIQLVDAMRFSKIIKYSEL